MQRMKRILSSEKGETILETLVALLIIVLSISFLSASIAKSASISHEIGKTTENGFTYDDSEDGSARLSDNQGVISSSRKEVTVYKVDKGDGGTFYYYKP